jgi:TPR repeat protein
VAKAPVPTVPAARKPVREAAPQVETPDPSEALFSDGQRYLYGTGVPENCTLARTKLMAAANQSNPRAQSTVATMYATGHCLPRNLPSAYHWFAQALHKERDNMRLQRDLEMLWNQMTPEEKQVALKSR